MKRNDIKIYSIIGCLITIILLFGLVMGGRVDKLAIGNVNDLNEGWQLKVGADSFENEPLVLPQLLDTDEIIHISRRLPIDFNYGQSIRVRSSMQNLRVTLGGEELYNNTATKSNIFPYTVEASAWVMIDVPVDSAGELIEIEVSSDIPVMQGRLNGIYYGSRGDLIGALLVKQLPTILVLILVFAVAIFTMLISITIRLHNINRLYYLSAFALTIGLWLLSEIDIMQLLTGNGFVVGTISYITLPIATMMFINYIREVALEKYTFILRLFTYYFGVDLVVRILLQFSLGLDYIRLWSLFILMLLVLIITLVVILIYESLHKSKVALKLLVFIGLLLLTTIIESWMFLIGDFMNVSSLSNIGIGLFLLLLVMDTMNYINKVVQKEGESKYLREIAYKDTLTGGNNRAAFEKDIDDLLSAKPQKPFRLTMFDLNNLKRINDDHGHEVGDQALIDFYNNLVLAFTNKSKAYRIGGDEFMVIHEDPHEEDYKASLRDLLKALDLKEKTVIYDLSTAYGSGVYQFETKFGEFKHRVDQLMYKHKFESKEVQ